MQKQIENEIEKFAKLTGLTERVTISHGTLYALLLQPERCDFFHGVIRTFYKDNINEDGGVNMYAVGDEFAFDFVEGDKDNYVGETDDGYSIEGIFKGQVKSGLPSKVNNFVNFLNC